MLELYGTIAEESWFDDDITPAMFREELFAGDGDIVIWINSPGGDLLPPARSIPCSWTTREVPQYYVKNSHPAIISPVDWQKVQDEMQRRRNDPRQHNGLSPFSGKLFCGDCGEMYGAKVWHSNDQYRRVVWQCNNKFTAKKKCANLRG